MSDEEQHDDRTVPLDRASQFDWLGPGQFSVGSGERVALLRFERRRVRIPKVPLRLMNWPVWFDRMWHTRSAKQIGQGRTMATRVNAREEKLATMMSVMNVIAALDFDHPPRPFQTRPIDFRGFLHAQAAESDDDWTEAMLIRRNERPHQEA
jgi:hypothetical protein